MVGGFSHCGGSLFSAPRLCSFESGRMVHLHGRLLLHELQPFQCLGPMMWQQTMWWKIQAPMRRFLRFPSLVESSGKLLLVAAVRERAG
ncbi:hypothetical protein M0R45_014034 [Rubus argutus]|uniref:Uncharacterized protein n=1 Tax=Rubus argutus TaxID=59490 RepID=A0AAW1XK94_RUBAR